jgi:uncharacterized membrane protein
LDEPTRIGPAAQYRHDHPPVRDINALHEEKMSLGQRVADRVATAVGSWPFIIIQSVLLLLWMFVNVYLAVMIHRHPGYLKAWDPYPFILLNLVLSFQAAYTGPVVMMSQNRQAEKDRLMAQNDYEINQKAEEEIEVIMEHLAHQDRLLLDAMKRLESLNVTPPVAEVAQKIDRILERMEENDRRTMALIDRLENGRA